MQLNPYVMGALAVIVLVVSVSLATITAPVAADLASGNFFCSHSTACTGFQLSMTVIVLVTAFLIFVILWESIRIKPPKTSKKAKRARVPQKGALPSLDRNEFTPSMVSSSKKKATKARSKKVVKKSTKTKAKKKK